MFDCTLWNERRMIVNMGGFFLDPAVDFKQTAIEL